MTAGRAESQREITLLIMFQIPGADNSRLLGNGAGRSDLAGQPGPAGHAWQPSRYERRLKGHAGDVEVNTSEGDQRWLQMHKKTPLCGVRAYSLRRSASASAWRGRPPGTCSLRSRVGPGTCRGGFAVPRDTRPAQLCPNRY